MINEVKKIISVYEDVRVINDKEWAGFIVAKCCEENYELVCRASCSASHVRRNVKAYLNIMKKIVGSLSDEISVILLTPVPTLSPWGPADLFTPFKDSIIAAWVRRDFPRTPLEHKIYRILLLYAIKISRKPVLLGLLYYTPFTVNWELFARELGIEELDGGFVFYFLKHSNNTKTS